MHHDPLKQTFTAEDGRKFGVSVGLAFLALAALLWWREKETAMTVLASIGAILIIAGLLVPAQLGPVYRGWMKFALLISKVTTPLFMGIIYFGLFLVTGLIRRAMGKNAMIRVPENGSFWAVRERTRGDLERQF